jgi:hypothetical protein
MTKVLMIPSTLTDAAKTCKSVAHEAMGRAHHIRGFQGPPLAPPEVMGLIRDAADQLHNSARASDSEASFLKASARRGLLADGPSDKLDAIHVPPLLSPWGTPGKGGKKHSSLHDLLKGGWDEAKATAMGLVDTAVALAAHRLDSMVPGLSGKIPWVRDRKREFDEGVKWAITHRDEFLGKVGSDMISLDLWKKHHYAEAIGHNVVGLASLFVSLGKLGRASEVAHGAAKGVRSAGRELSAAERESGGLTVGGKGTASNSPLRVRLPDVPKTSAQLMHDRAIQHANDKIDNATDKVKAANHELNDARNERNHEVKKAVGEVLKAGGISSAKILDEPAQPPQESGR